MKTWKPIAGRTLEYREDREVEYWNEYDTEGDPLIQVTPDEGSKLVINLPGLRLCEEVDVDDPQERIASALERIAESLTAMEPT